MDASPTPVRPCAASEGNRLATEGKITEATKAFDQAVRLLPDKTGHVAEGLAARAFNEGNRLATEGKIAEATIEFDLAVRLQPDKYRYTPKEMVNNVLSPQADAADERGRTLAAEGKTAEAVESFRRARSSSRSSIRTTRAKKPSRRLRMPRLPEPTVS